MNTLMFACRRQRHHVADYNLRDAWDWRGVLGVPAVHMPTRSSRSHHRRFLCDGQAEIVKQLRGRLRDDVDI